MIVGIMYILKEDWGPIFILSFSEASAEVKCPVKLDEVHEGGYYLPLRLLPDLTEKELPDAKLLKDLVHRYLDSIYYAFNLI